MSTDARVIEGLLEQAAMGPRLTSRRMFGEYALYVDTKVVAFVCDNQVFLKPNEGCRSLLLKLDEAPPYPGAKMYWRLGEEIDDRDRLRRLLHVTAESLPLPKPKAVKKTKVAAKTTVGATKPSKSS